MRSSPSPPTNVRALLHELIESWTELATPLPSSRRLAQKWGVDHSRISRAIGECVAVGRLLRQGYRVFKASQEPGRPRPVESQIRIFADGGRHLRFMERLARMRGFSPRGTVWEYSDAGDRRTLETLLDGPALISIPREHSDDILRERFYEQGLPIVTVRRTVAGIVGVKGNFRSEVELALRYLAQLGHREIGMVWDGAEVHSRHASVAIGMRRAVAEQVRDDLGLGGPPILNLRRVGSLPLASLPVNLPTIEAFCALMRAQALTAAVMPASVWTDVAPLVEEHRPDLSVVGIGSSEDAAAMRFLTTSGASFRDEVLVALEHLRAMMTSERPVQRGLEILCEPELVVRGSTRPAGEARQRASPTRTRRRLMLKDVVNEPFWDRPWHADREERLAQVVAMNTEPYEWDGPPPEFEIVPLGSYLNRSTLRPHSWFGKLPLNHLQRGEMWIHGVRFHIAEESEEHPYGALLMRSARCHRSGDVPLPSQIAVPVSGKVRAVSLLHAAGNSQRFGPFARYGFILSDGSEHWVPVCVLGVKSRDDRGLDHRTGQSNIQEWWPGPAQLRTSDAKFYVVTSRGDPNEYERYLYTLRWRNPTPEIPLAAIRIQSEPSEAATLAILALSLAR